MISDAVFRPGIFHIFFGGFRESPGWKTASMFQIFSIFPFRMRWVSRIFLLDPVAGTIALGTR